jgi:deoxycytidine triphosphate deaminase
MILSRKKIQETLAGGILNITPFTESNLKEASYTFTLNKKALKLASNQVLEVGIKPAQEPLTIPKRGYSLQPGEFLIGYTKEKLSLNGAFACQLSARGSCAQIGLNVLLSDTFAEPDTNGTLALAINNASNLPILLFEDMKIVKGIFLEIQ